MRLANEALHVKDFLLALPGPMVAVMRRVEFSFSHASAGA